MNTTEYHAKYFAHEITKQGGDGVERLSRSLFDACVDLNPHQIEAALFAVRSPISQGVLLADEVGLGKTIEAALVLCQYWAERKRKLLVICPASLRKQWELELKEKFNLSGTVLDAKTYREAQNAGNPNPFDSDRIVITSMHYASRQAGDIRAVQWDMVVIDEAHKLRNAYRQSNRMGQNIKWALNGSRKILLTATPLQNSLLELYGLSTIIDDRIFGDLPSFRSQYTNVGGDIDDLRHRLNSFCTRTLRHQISEYIQYTERKLITRPFNPTEQEHKLYEAVSGFLQREGTYALPQQQKHLTTLVVRKLLASSPHAVAGTLETMRDRLIELRDNRTTSMDIADRIIESEEIEEEILEELLNNDNGLTEEDQPQAELPLTIDRKRLDDEINELDGYAQWARSIGIDTKTRSLNSALKIGFEEMSKMGAAQKAIIFTESRRTQQYLKDFLEGNGYADQIITFNGTNRELESTKIYDEWVAKNTELGRVSGSRPIDVRTALIEYFRDKAQIMIATEAAAEGINLQFCSLVINFDLPWNPQRIEQRIGRCHRYGQKHDVVVINFLNKRNEADSRVYELLNEKFNLFSGVFGVSDEVLGTIESGVDFERRILDIYQQCRTQEEIEHAFQRLRDEMDEKISSKMDNTRKLLLEHFDEDVHSRLKVNLAGTREQLDRIGRMFWILTMFILNKQAEFNEHSFTFDLHNPPLEPIKTGTYHLISKQQENISGEYLYRLSHPLGEYVIENGKQCPAPLSYVTFDISNYPVKISVVEKLKGQSGWLTLKQMNIDSFEREEYLLFSGFSDEGLSIDQETCEKLFHCSATQDSLDIIQTDIQERLNQEADRYQKATIAKSLETNSIHFNEARERLEKWADDMVLAAEKELKDTKEQIKALNRQSRLAPTIDEQHQIQKKITDMEKKKRRQRQKIFDIEDEIMDKRDSLVDGLEKRMKQKTSVKNLFTIRWQVV